MRKDYYVYTHSDMDYNVFYVGKGTRNRAWSKERNKKWKEKTKEPYVVEIRYDNLTEEEALDCEAMLIELYGVENLCNIKKESSKNNTFYYDILQKAKDIKVLMEMTDEDLKNPFIKEQLELILFIESIQKEVDMLK